MILLVITTNHHESIYCEVPASKPIVSTIQGLMSLYDGRDIEILGVYL